MRRGSAAVLALSWLVAFNLRSGFIGLGPALPDLTADLGISFSQASFLVAAPTLMMGLMAVPGGGLADRWGPAKVIAAGLGLVAVGGGLRAIAPEFVLLLVLTVLFGAGIGLSQPSLPRLMRSRFPRRLGVTTGMYASGLISGSIVAASFTGPFLDRMEDPAAWRMPMALWGVLAAIAFVGWVGAMRPWGAVETAAGARALPSEMVAAAWSPWRDRRAWMAALLFAAQGLVYYLLVAWLPAIYSGLQISCHSELAKNLVFSANVREHKPRSFVPQDDNFSEHRSMARRGWTPPRPRRFSRCSTPRPCRPFCCFRAGQIGCAAVARRSSWPRCSF